MIMKVKLNANESHISHMLPFTNEATVAVSRRINGAAIAEVSNS